MRHEEPWKINLEQYLLLLADLTDRYERSHDNSSCLLLLCPVGTDFLNEQDSQVAYEWNGESMKPIRVVFGSRDGDTITKVESGDIQCDTESIWK